LKKKVFEGKKRGACKVEGGKLGSRGELSPRLAVLAKNMLGILEKKRR